MALKEYRRKRQFQKTPEPPPTKEVAQPITQVVQQTPLSFVVQLHAATRLHFDLRLELDGVFQSWAVPRGPSLNPTDQRLAVHVENHPLEYGGFEGIIPSGNYGAGTVMIWDRGTFTARCVNGEQPPDVHADAVRKGFRHGHITIVMAGHRLKGEFALIHTRGKQWLLVKKR